MTPIWKLDLGSDLCPSQIRAWCFVPRKNYLTFFNHYILRQIQCPLSFSDNRHLSRHSTLNGDIVKDNDALAHPRFLLSQKNLEPANPGRPPRRSFVGHTFSGNRQGVSSTMTRTRVHRLPVTYLIQIIGHDEASERGLGRDQGLRVQTRHGRG
jgi:hypothetical protein